MTIDAFSFYLVFSIRISFFIIITEGETIIRGLESLLAFSRGFFGFIFPWRSTGTPRRHLLFYLIDFPSIPVLNKRKTVILCLYLPGSFFPPKKRIKRGFQSFSKTSQAWTQYQENKERDKNNQDAVISPSHFMPQILFFSHLPE